MTDSRIGPSSFGDAKEKEKADVADVKAKEKARRALLTGISHTDRIRGMKNHWANPSGAKARANIALAKASARARDEKAKAKARAFRSEVVAAIKEKATGSKIPMTLPQPCLDSSQEHNLLLP